MLLHHQFTKSNWNMERDEVKWLRGPRKACNELRTSFCSLGWSCTHDLTHSLLSFTEDTSRDTWALWEHRPWPLSQGLSGSVCSCHTTNPPHKHLLEPGAYLGFSFGAHSCLILPLLAPVLHHSNSDLAAVRSSGRKVTFTYQFNFLEKKVFWE